MSKTRLMDQLRKSGGSRLRVKYTARELGILRELAAEGEVRITPLVVSLTNRGSLLKRTHRDQRTPVALIVLTVAVLLGSCCCICLWNGDDPHQHSTFHHPAGQ